MHEVETMFLSEAEVERLTDKTQPAAQERVLLDMGLKPYRNHANRVMVAREAVIRLQLGHKPEKVSREPTVRMVRG